MAQETRRGCGYRKHGGTYLVGAGLTAPCDRLPIPLEVCPVCNEGLKFHRSPRQINAAGMFGIHQVKVTIPTGQFSEAQVDETCKEANTCFVCNPPADVPCYIIGVGERNYTPESFCQEALAMGVSKRIPAIPKNIKVGESVVFLSHKKAILRGKDDKGENAYQHGIFYAFKPQRIERIYWQSEDTPELRERCEKQGVTPVFFADGDADHQDTAKVKGVE